MLLSFLPIMRLTVPCGAHTVLQVFHYSDSSSTWYTLVGHIVWRTAGLDCILTSLPHSKWHHREHMVLCVLIVFLMSTCGSDSMKMRTSQLTFHHQQRIHQQCRPPNPSVYLPPTRSKQCVGSRLSQVFILTGSDLLLVGPIH